jgi:hypothetical protein
MTHRERRGWIEAASQQNAGAINERLARAMDDDFAGAFQVGSEPAGLLRVWRGDQAFGHRLDRLGHPMRHVAPA